MTAPSIGGAQFVRSSDQSLLIYFGQSKENPDANRATTAKDPRRAHSTLTAANENVRKLLQLLTSRPLSGVRNLNPAYRSLLVTFDALQFDHDEIAGQLRESLAYLQEVSLPEPRLVEIPVCYGGELGPDLDEVAQMHSLTPQQVIELHTSTTYRV